MARPDPLLRSGPPQWPLSRFAFARVYGDKGWLPADQRGKGYRKEQCEGKVQAVAKDAEPIPKWGLLPMNKPPDSSELT